MIEAIEAKMHIVNIVHGEKRSVTPGSERALGGRFETASQYLPTPPKAYMVTPPATRVPHKRSNPWTTSASATLRIPPTRTYNIITNVNIVVPTVKTVY